MAMGVFLAAVLLLAHVSLVWGQSREPMPYHASAALGGNQSPIRRGSCKKIPLTKKQRSWCRSNYVFLEPIASGAKLGLNECERRFSGRRWNCPVKSPSTFGKIYSKASRETAFVHSIQSAGITLAIARTCSQGKVSKWCGCDRTWTKKPHGNFTWGPCSDNYDKGYLFTKQFLDRSEDGNTGESLMALHNYEAGRRVVRHEMKLLCKCHGLSGGCVHKVCWYSVPKIQVIGKTLMVKYDNALRVKVDSPRARLVPSDALYRRPTLEDLVYMRMSPNYCERNDNDGSLGTRGRKCDRLSHAPSGCNSLCCGRGYNVRRRIQTKKCNCRFYWCCRVICDFCREATERYTCK